MEQEIEGDPNRVVEAINTLTREVQTLAQGQQELWEELDRRTTIDPGSLALAQKLEQVHNDLRWLLGLVGAVNGPVEDPPTDDDSKEEEEHG